MISFLHAIQPLARLDGRIRHGLTPWRKRGIAFNYRFIFLIRPMILFHWSEQWHPAEQWLSEIEENLVKMKTRYKRGGVFDRWDFQVRNGLFAKSRGLLTIEEHGAQKQYLKFKCWSTFSTNAWIISLTLLPIGIIAATVHEWVIAVIILALESMIISHFLFGKATSMHSIYNAFVKMSLQQKHDEEIITIPPDQKNTHNGNGVGEQITVKKIQPIDV